MTDAPPVQCYVHLDPDTVESKVCAFHVEGMK